MKKKGFTLVELLAVIAILAILVIMALPAVLRMFNSARRDSFTNEVNTVIRTSRQQYLLSGGTDTTWSNAEGSTKTLDLTGNSNLKYYVKMNNEGKITKLQVSNGDFQYNVTNNNGIDVASSNDVQEVTDENAIEVGKVTYVYSIGTGTKHIGDRFIVDNSPERFRDYTYAYTGWGYTVFTAHVLDGDNRITDSYLGFILNNQPYYLRGGDSFSENKAIVDDAFGASACIMSNEGTSEEGYYCHIIGMHVTVYTSGKLANNGGNGKCWVFADGSGYCMDN